MPPTAGPHDEREVKAAITDAAGLVRRLHEAGATCVFAGLMEDRRLDRGRELRGRDEVLRVRTLRAKDAPVQLQLAWKGATRRSPEGHKLRQELEWTVDPGSTSPAALFEALGYAVAESIDRYIEVYQVGSVTLRLEWYPRMDVLLEVEGSAAAIEQGILATGLPRALFVPESLPEFVTRYQRRTGQAAALSLAELEDGQPSWECR